MVTLGENAGDLVLEVEALPKNDWRAGHELALPQREILEVRRGGRQRIQRAKRVCAPQLKGGFDFVQKLFVAHARRSGRGRDDAASWRAAPEPSTWRRGGWRLPMARSEATGPPPGR